MTLVVSPVEIVRRAEESGLPGLLARSEDWPRVPLGEIANIVNGAPFSSRLFNNTGKGLPLVRIRDVARGATDTFYDGPYDEVHCVKSGDLLVGMDGDFRAAVWRSGTALLNQRVCRVEVSRPEAYDPSFLRHVLQGYLDAVWAETSAVTVKHLSSKTLAQMPLPLPPLEEQRRIVAILEEHLSRLDAADVSLSGIERLSPLLADSIRDRAFSGALIGGLTAGISAITGEDARERLLATRRDLYPVTAKRGRPEPLPPVAPLLPVPGHWAVMSLEEITDPIRTISYGILKPGPNLPDGVPYVRVVNMRGDRLDLAGLHRTSSTIASQYERASLAANDVLVSIRGTYGRVVLVPEELSGGNITQDTARLAVIAGVDPRFVREYLRSRAVQRHLHVVARGVAVKGVNIADLRQVPIGIPPMDEQVAIMDALDDALSLSTAAAEAVYISQRRSGALRRSLLSAAFSGQLTKEPSLV